MEYSHFKGLCLKHVKSEVLWRIVTAVVNDISPHR